MNKLDFGAAAKAVAGFIVALFTFAFGKPDQWFISLIIFLVLDYFTGITAAFINKELSNKTGFNGILKKVMYLAVVVVGCSIDNALDFTGVVREIVIGFLVANEGLSILENCANCGLPIPKKLINVLKQIRKEDDESNDE